MSVLRHSWELSVPLTVTAGLDGCLNVADALNGDTVLVVTVHVLVLKLSDFIDQHTQLVCHIRDVIVARLAPNGKLLLKYY
jgi:hypothetical protein